MAYLDCPNGLPVQLTLTHLPANGNARVPSDVNDLNQRREGIHERISMARFRILDSVAKNSTIIKEALDQLLSYGLDINPLKMCIEAAPEREEFLRGKKPDVLLRYFLEYLRDIKSCLMNNTYSDHPIEEIRKGSNTFGMKVRNGLAGFDMGRVDELDSRLVDLYKRAAFFDGFDVQEVPDVGKEMSG